MQVARSEFTYKKQKASEWEEEEEEGGWEEEEDATADLAMGGDLCQFPRRVREHREGDREIRCGLMHKLGEFTDPS